MLNKIGGSKFYKNHIHLNYATITIKKQNNEKNNSIHIPFIYFSISHQ